MKVVSLVKRIFFHHLGANEVFFHISSFDMIALQLAKGLSLNFNASSDPGSTS